MTISSNVPPPAAEGGGMEDEEPITIRMPTPPTMPAPSGEEPPVPDDASATVPN